MSVGIRKRVYRDRELDQLARDVDESLRDLDARMPAQELHPAQETRTGATWRGRPVFARSLSGTFPGNSTGNLVSGVDELVDLLGHVSVSIAPDAQFSVHVAVYAVVDAEGNLSLERVSGSGIGPYDVTAYYTRRGVNG